MTLNGERYMHYLARKIQRAKWDPSPNIPAEEIRADAITGGCLKTSDDNLSLWQCRDSREDVEEIALVLASTMNKIEGIHIVLLNKELLRNSKLSLESTQGITPIEDLRGRHIDLTNLTMRKVCKIAEHVKAALPIQSQFYQFTRAQIREILRRAIESDRIKLEQLRKDQKELKELKQEIEKTFILTPK
jgi:hypothetical protein